MKSSATRIERDTFGPIEVPAHQLWGAQTQRSLKHFDISTERMPEDIILALAAVKSACAQVNRDLGLLPNDKAMATRTSRTPATIVVLTGILGSGWVRKNKPARRCRANATARHV